MPASPRRNRELFRIWVRHSTALAPPLWCLGFLASGPHGGWHPLLGLALPLCTQLLDGRARPDAPPRDLPSWPFDVLLGALAAIHLVIIGLLLRQAATWGWTLDLGVATYLVGSYADASAIAVAHELIHRRQRPLRLIGRALLCTVLYDHFAVEHVRGHHARVGTPADPATARFGEPLGPFLRRTVVGQWRSAWTLEKDRLGIAAGAGLRWRLFGSQVLQGLCVELGLALAVVVWGGPRALVVFIVQAVGAIATLETVNYLEHWGLVRSGPRVRPVDSWDTDSWWTLYSLVGLSRHADHHAHPARPFQALAPSTDSAHLPLGYHRMLALAQLNNRRFRRLMERELARRGLGPFAVRSTPDPSGRAVILTPHPPSATGSSRRGRLPTAPRHDFPARRLLPAARVSAAKAFAALLDGGERERKNHYLVGGVRLLATASAAGVVPAQLLVCREALGQGSGPGVVERWRRAGVPTLELSAGELATLWPGRDAQGVVAVLPRAFRPLPAAVRRRDLWLAVDHIRSPGNLGSMLRSCAAAGGRGLVLLLPTAVDPFAPDVVRASMGAIHRLELTRAGADAFLRWKRARRVLAVGTAPDATRDYRTLGDCGPVVLLLGNERRGLSLVQHDLCDVTVRIPMAPGIDSLNVAVATAVLCYQVFSARHPLRRR
jgi:alkane 1-monooxygenase